MVFSVLPRQYVNTEPSQTGGDWWWDSPVAYAVKWAIIGGILLVFASFFILAYFHAQRRIKKGLAPLRYHRWLLPRRQRMFYANQAERGYHNSDFAYYGQPGGFPMGPAPPAYNEPDYVPPYSPPAVLPNKTNPDQSYIRPPSGPPPGATLVSEAEVPVGIRDERTKNEAAGPRPTPPARVYSGAL